MKPSGTIPGAMPAVRLLVITALAITLLSCAPHRTHGSAESATQAVEQVIEAQDRVNRQLHQQVVPRLLSCWGEIEGEGTLAVQQGYTRQRDLWIAGEATVTGTSLTQGQDERALRCFQEAVRGTSFAVERDDGEAQEFLVNWSLPVPWPKDVQEVALRMATNPGGGGGCGGPEAPPPACWTCGFIPIIGFSYCAKSCAGYKDCTVISHGCKLSPINPRCVTASPFGNLGGIVLY